jgi:spore germination cell wall hydrolase CwlJ-like protein
LLFQLENHLRRHLSAHVAGVQLVIAALMCPVFAASAWPAYASLEAPAKIAPAAAPAASAAPMAAEHPAIRLRELSPQAAQLWNTAARPASRRMKAAEPFHLAAADMLDEARATDCMTAAIYYEAGVEGLQGQRAVAQVVLNRLHSPLFPKSVCGVVFQGSRRRTGCQFTFTCDGSLARKPGAAAWARARKVAVAALNGFVMTEIGDATNYHADYVAPRWSPALVKVAVVGRHVFYRWARGLALPAVGGDAGGGLAAAEIATLDSLSRSGPLALTGADEASAPQTASAIEAKRAETGAEAGQLVTASVAAQEAGALLKPEPLDGRGRF